MNTRDHLNAIRAEFGTLTPELVADVAAAEDHPLHAQVYDCAPAEASRRYYVSRAAQLLRVTYRPIPGKPIDLRAFQVYRGEESATSEYVPTEEILADPLATAIVLRQMKRDWQTFKRRYDHMAEFAAYIQSQIKGEAS